MATVRIWRDAVYPVYGISTPTGCGHPIEVDDETVTRWQRIEDEYVQMQDEIEAAAKQHPECFNGKRWTI